MQYRPLQCRIVPVGWRMVTPYSTNAMNFVILLYFVSRTKVSLFIFLSTLRFFFSFYSRYHLPPPFLSSLFYFCSSPALPLPALRWYKSNSYKAHRETG